MHYRINTPRIISETIGQESLMIDTLTGTYFCTAGVGSQIWQWLGQGAAVADIESALGGGDVAGFLAALLEAELIVAVEAGNPVAPLAPSAIPYAPPVLQRFTDMESLLVLDPLHESGEAGWPQRA